jgi:hypothetical protein
LLLYLSQEENNFFFLKDLGFWRVLDSEKRCGNKAATSAFLGNLTLSVSPSRDRAGAGDGDLTGRAGAELIFQMENVFHVLIV